jgi:hypothetical protein
VRNAVMFVLSVTLVIMGLGAALVVSVREINRPQMAQIETQQKTIDALVTQVTELTDVMLEQIDVMGQAVGALTWMPYAMLGGFLLLALLIVGGFVVMGAQTHRTVRAVLEFQQQQLTAGRQPAGVLPNPEYPGWVDVEAGSAQMHALLAQGWTIADEYAREG